MHHRRLLCTTPCHIWVGPLCHFCNCNHKSGQLSRQNFLQPRPEDTSRIYIIASSEQKKELLHRLSSILSLGAESSTFLAATGGISNCISGLHSLAYLLPVHAYCIYSHRCSYNMFLNWQLYTGFPTPSPVTVIENLLPQHTSLPISS